MANPIKDKALLRFLSGKEENLTNLPLEEGTVYFALKPDPLNATNTIGSIYVDTDTQRVMMSGESLAILDGQGEAILQKYIKSISMSGDAGSKATLTYLKGGGADVTVDMPSAASNKAGVVTTGTQTFAGQKTFNGVLIPKAGSYVHSGVGKSGTAGYVKLAQIVIGGTYQDMPIILELADRSRAGSCVLNIRFKNTNGNDPELDTFTYQGINYNCHLHKSATSTWDLYVKKGEGYGQPTVVRYHKSPYMSKVAVTWTDEHAAEVPAGAETAKLGGNVLHASEADSATKAIQDGSGFPINTTYLKDLDSKTDASTFQFWGIRGNTTEGTVISVPAATTAIAGLVTTGTQEWTGNKTIDENGSLTIEQEGGLNYSGIQEGTTATARAVWFGHSSVKGTPVNHTGKFTYNPGATDKWEHEANAPTSGYGLVKADRFDGLARKAVSDGLGKVISNSYVAKIDLVNNLNTEKTSGKIEYQFINGNNATIDTEEVLGNRLHSHDIRQKPVLAPNEVPLGLYLRFANRTAVHESNSDSGTYVGVMSWRSYGGGVNGGDDLTGGYPMEIMYTQSGNLWTRVGTGKTTWGSWAKILTTANAAGILDGRYVNVTGDTMTGNLSAPNLTATGTVQGDVLYALTRVSILSNNGNYNFYNGGTSYFVGNVGIEGALTQTGTATFENTSTFKQDITLSGANTGIEKAGSSVYWYQGRDSAAIKTTSYSGYNAIYSLKTTNGDWSAGVHTNDGLHWTFIKDADYTAKNNAVTAQMTLSSAGLLTVPSLSVTGNASVGGTLGVTGKATFTSPVQMNSELTVNGAILGKERLTIGQGAINTDYNLYINGTTYFSGKMTGGTSATLHLTNETDAAANSDNNVALIIGNRAGTHLIMDGNEIIAKTNGTTGGPLYLNSGGSNVVFGAGITLNGDITYTNGDYTDYPIIKFTTGNANGCGITIGGGGSVIIGAGESASAYRSANNVAGDNEVLYMTSDSAMKFVTNCDTIGNAKLVTLDGSRNFYPEDTEFGSIGTSTKRWGSAYFKTLDVSTTSTFGEVMTFQSGAAHIVQHTNSTSNWVQVNKWWKGSTAPTEKYAAGIGWHNTGGTDNVGAITINPYPTNSDPWGQSVGLYITKGVLKLDGQEVFTSHSYTTLDNRYVNVTGDTMTGNLVVKHDDGSDVSVKVDKAGLAVSLLCSTNRGLYDNSRGKWLIYTNIADSNVTTIPTMLKISSEGLRVLGGGIEAIGNSKITGTFTVTTGNSYFDKTVIISSQVGNYGEGIRLNAEDGQWTTITMGSAGDTGTRANCWSIHRKSDNNFCISRNSSDGVNGLVMTPTGMGLGTATPSYRLHVAGDVYANGGWFRSSGANGWYSQDYGGGIHMQGSTFVEVYNKKAFKTTNLIFSYAYDSGTGKNKPAYVLDKPGSHFSGVGSHDSTDTIFFGPVSSSDYSWVANYYQIWQFQGAITLETGAGGNTYSRNYISAGRGYSVNSGKNGLKLIATEQDDAISGIGQDCTGKAYELTIGAALGTSGQGYITFTGHKMASLNTYSELGHFNFATSVFYVNGSVGIGTTTPAYKLDVQGKGRFTDRLYLNEWAEFTTTNGLYWSSPDAYGMHIYPNTVSTYTGVIIRGQKNDYHGLLLGTSNEYMNVMSGIIHQGLYNESKGRWIIYYKRDVNKISIGNATIRDNHFLNIGGSTYVDGALYASGTITSTRFEGTADRSKYLETWYTAKDKTYGTQYPLYAYWETNTVCKLTVDGYSTKVDLANALTIDAGSNNQPVYFTGGKPAAIDWRIGNSSTGEHNANSVTYNFCGYYNTNGPGTNIGATTGDGALYAQAYSTSWVAQIAQDYRNGNLFVRGKNNGTWTSWVKVLTNSDISATLDGRYVNVSGDTMTGALTVPNITISSTSGISHIKFSRTSSYNYIHVPGNSGSIGFCANESLSLANCALIVSNTGIHPGANAVFTLGTSSDYWSRAHLGAITMYGNITYANGSYTDYEVIKFVTGNGDGCGVVIGGGGLAVFGSGESASNYVSAAGHTGNSETTYITSDGSIYFVTNCQSIGSRNERIYMSGGQICVPGSSTSWYLGRSNALIKTTSYSGYNAIYSLKTTNGDWSCGVYSNNTLYWTYVTDTNFNAGTNTTTAQMYLTANGYLYAPRVYNAVWNDYAECRSADTEEPGRVVIEGKFGIMTKSTKRLQAGGGIVSDTYGSSMGETDTCKTPIAVAGRVLAYPYEDRHSYPLGAAVCTGPNGTVSLMTREEIREYPERIIGTVSEIPEYETWGTGNVKVNGRIWIKVK